MTPELNDIAEGLSRAFAAVQERAATMLLDPEYEGFEAFDIWQVNDISGDIIKVMFVINPIGTSWSNLMRETYPDAHVAVRITRP